MTAAAATFPAMGNGLKMLRNSRGWTQDEAAAAFGLSSKGYIKIENGERGLSKKWIEKAQEVYDVPAFIVLGAEGHSEDEIDADFFREAVGLTPEERKEATAFFQYLKSRRHK